MCPKSKGLSLAFILGLAACSRAPVSSNSPVNYVAPGLFSCSIPGDWRVLGQDEFSLASFIPPSGQRHVKAMISVQYYPKSRYASPEKYYRHWSYVAATNVAEDLNPPNSPISPQEMGDSSIPDAGKGKPLVSKVGPLIKKNIGADIAYFFSIEEPIDKNIHSFGRAKEQGIEEHYIIPYRGGLYTIYFLGSAATASEAELVFENMVHSFRPLGVPKK